MSLYEFDMVKRFLENREYFDMPGDVVVLAILYCIVMFAMKIMLKQCQKTTVSSDYVSNVITAVDGTGLKTMKFCLQVARTNLVLSQPCFKTEHIDVKNCDETCHIEVQEKTPVTFPDLLSSDGKQAEANPSDHHFLQELQTFVKKNKNILTLPNDIEKSFRDTRSKLDINDMISEQVMNVKGFIVRFWEGIQSRLDHGGLSPGVTSYSEAPAEGIFSIIESVLNGRERLSVELTEALTRIVLEGPGVATMDGYNLSKDTLKMWKSKYGERFTTEKWMKGMKDKAMVEIQEGKLKK